MHCAFIQWHQPEVNKAASRGVNTPGKLYCSWQLQVRGWVWRTWRIRVCSNQQKCSQRMSGWVDNTIIKLNIISCCARATEERSIAVMLITVNLGSNKDIKEAGKTEMEKISDELLMFKCSHVTRDVFLKTISNTSTYRNQYQYYVHFFTKQVQIECCMDEVIL